MTHGRGRQDGSAGFRADREQRKREVGRDSAASAGAARVLVLVVGAQGLRAASGRPSIKWRTCPPTADQPHEELSERTDASALAERHARTIAPLAEVRRAEDNRAGGSQAADDGRISWRHRAHQCEGACMSLQVLVGLARDADVALLSSAGRARVQRTLMRIGRPASGPRL